MASSIPGATFRNGALAARVCDSPKPPRERITLTPQLLATARASFILAVGESKRSALERLRDRDPDLPVTGLPNLTVVTDLDLSATPPAARGEQ